MARPEPEEVRPTDRQHPPPSSVVSGRLRCWLVDPLGDRLKLDPGEMVERGSRDDPLLGWSATEREAVALLGGAPIGERVALMRLADGHLAGVAVTRD